MTIPHHLPLIPGEILVHVSPRSMTEQSEPPGQAATEDPCICQDSPILDREGSTASSQQALPCGEKHSGALQSDGADGLLHG